MSDSMHIDPMIHCSCGRRHLKSDRCDGPARGVVLDLAAAPCDTMQFVADLDPGHPQHCVIESRWDVILKKQITVVRYIPDVTTSVEFARAFNAHRDAHGLRVSSDDDVKLDANGNLIATEMPWPAGVLDRIRDPARQVTIDIECTFKSNEMIKALSEERDRPLLLAMLDLAYDPAFWAARQAAKREARKRRQRRKTRRGWA